tara:strand:+ start:321 stop:515 length:195 start_codon:yes stop_codon:yes gene_type:complete
MEIRESKTEVRLDNVKPFEPQVIRILDNKGVCIAFVVAGHNSTAVQIGLCQEDNFELELDKELV